MSEDKPRFIPAANVDWLTPLYDPVLRWVMRERGFKRRLIEQARIQPRQRVLDLGCGTATLTLMIAERHPETELVGFDADPRILEIARRKIARAGAKITLEEGMAFELPYPDCTFDRVVSSLVFHHLTPEDKRRTLAEVLRVLRPGGQLHIVDFGPPSTRAGRLFARIFHPGEEQRDNIGGRLPALFREAGFEGVEETARVFSLSGSLSFYRAQRAA